MHTKHVKSVRMCACVCVVYERGDTFRWNGKTFLKTFVSVTELSKGKRTF